MRNTLKLNAALTSCAQRPALLDNNSGSTIQATKRGFNALNGEPM